MRVLSFQKRLGDSEIEKQLATLLYSSEDEFDDDTIPLCVSDFYTVDHRMISEGWIQV
jgi:hypothetical protein